MDTGKLAAFLLATTSPAVGACSEKPSVIAGESTSDASISDADDSSSGTTEGDGSGGVLPPLTPAFAGGIDNPFGLQDNASGIDFVDIDDDGDLDVFTTDGFRTRFFENTGSATSPSFASGQDSPFGLSDQAAGLDFVDIDADGDADGFSTDGFYTSWFENKGTAAAPSFGSGAVSPFGLEERATSLAFADIDDDDDLDVLTSDGFGIMFFENTGTVAAPSFGDGVSAPFDLGETAASIELIDIDRDGDLDIFTADGFGTRFFENTGSASSPTFAGAVSDPFGLSDRALGMDFADIDADGDLDAFTTDGFGTTYFENTSL